MGTGARCTFPGQNRAPLLWTSVRRQHWTWTRTRRVIGTSPFCPSALSLSVSRQLSSPRPPCPKSDIHSLLLLSTLSTLRSRASSLRVRFERETVPRDGCSPVARRFRSSCGRSSKATLSACSGSCPPTTSGSRRSPRNSTRRSRWTARPRPRAPPDLSGTPARLTRCERVSCLLAFVRFECGVWGWAGFEVRRALAGEGLGYTTRGKGGRRGGQGSPACVSCQSHPHVYGLLAWERTG